MKLTFIPLMAFLSIASSYAGTCTPHLTKVTRPFIALKYENKDYPTEKSTIEECLKKAQDIFQNEYGSLTKEDFSNRANLNIKADYVEANSYDPSRNATVTLAVFVPSGGDHITDKVFFPSSYHQAQNCNAYVQEKITYLNGTFGNRGQVDISPNLSGPTTLSRLNQCIALSAYTFLDSYTAGNDARLVVNFSNIAIKGSNRFYSVAVRTGIANFALRNAFKETFEKLQDGRH